MVGCEELGAFEDIHQHQVWLSAASGTGLVLVKKITAETGTQKLSLLFSRRSSYRCHFYCRRHSIVVSRLLFEKFGVWSAKNLRSKKTISCAIGTRSPLCLACRCPIFGWASKHSFSLRSIELNLQPTCDQDTSCEICTRNIRTPKQMASMIYLY